MKIVKLMGGLGNQMFQYAFAKSMGDDVLFDDNWFKQVNNKYSRPYELNLLNTKINFAEENQINNCLNESKIAAKLTNLYKVFHIKILPTNRVYEKIRNKYEPELQSLSGDVYYDGYFQTPKYFESIRERLINDFTPKKELTPENHNILKSIQESNSVAISTRRGDYVKLGYALPTKYYNIAMEEIAKRVENPVFYLFSDDMDWSLKNINTDNKFRMIPCKSFDENCGYICGLYLMSKSKHNIITNSTYAWWAAWLNNNLNHIVVSPKNWINSSGIAKSTFNDLILNNWIKI